MEPSVGSKILADFLAQTVTPGEAVRFERHRSACKYCDNLVKEFNKMARILSDELASPERKDPKKLYPILETSSRIQPIIEVAARKLVSKVSSCLSSIVAQRPEYLYQLSSRQFEEFIAEVFDGFGYEVELTARTRDGGRDIVAIRCDHGLLSKLLIECKRFRPDRPVGIAHVRNLYAVKSLEHATKAILATTSYFTKGAKGLERRLIYELELKDFRAVADWAREYAEFLNSLRRESD